MGHSLNFKGVVLFMCNGMCYKVIEGTYISMNNGNNYPLLVKSFLKLCHLLKQILGIDITCISTILIYNVYYYEINLLRYLGYKIFYHYL